MAELRNAPPIHPVILSGGSGTRLWPMSRAHYPKQFLPLVSERTPAAGSGAARRRRRALRRAAGRSPTTSTASSSPSSCAALDVDAAGDRARAVRPQHRARRRASPRIALTASGPDALMLVMPSDHAIDDRAAFIAAVDARRRGRARRQARHLRHRRPTGPRPAMAISSAAQPLAGVDGALRGRRLRREARSRRAPKPISTPATIPGTAASSCFPAALYLQRAASGCSPTRSPPAARRSSGAQARSRFPAARPRRLRRGRDRSRSTTR